LSNENACRRFASLLDLAPISKVATASRTRHYLGRISASNPEHDRPRRLILLQVDQQLSEGPRRRVAPELTEPVGPLEVGQHEDVAEFGASRRGKASRRLRRARSISSKVM
jgi:hypothetical protein